MPIERATAAEAAVIRAVHPEMSKSEVIDLARRHDVAVWEGRATVSKFHADDDPARATPYEVVGSEPNVLTTAGVTNLWNLAAAIGNPTPWSNGNAHIAVGTGEAEADDSDTALGAEDTRQPMQDGFPSVSANVITFQAVYSTSSANIAWRELGVVSAGSGGILLNRLSGSWGEKVNTAQWVATLTVALS